MRTRLVAPIALAAAVLLGTTGCTLFAVTGTLVPYQASDGVAANVGDVKVRNLLGVSDNGDDIALSGAIINSSSADAEVSFQYETAAGEKQTVTVLAAANSTTLIGGSGAEAILRGVGAALGSTVNVYVQYGTHPGQQVKVPVLNGDLPEYGGLIPAPLPAVTQSPAPEDTIEVEVEVGDDGETVTVEG